MVNWLSLAVKDLRFAARLLVRTPAVSAIAVTEEAAPASPRPTGPHLLDGKP